MGKYDSSRTRVVPVFNALMDRDPTGVEWLLPLLNLGSGATGKLTELSGQLISSHAKWWGKKERRLSPPCSLLTWLVTHVSAPSSESFWGSPVTREKRERLVARDPKTVAEALRLLEQSVSKAWYVLEGAFQPDVYLETENFIVVIEGKRTERKATSSTTWMPFRSQMLRHMDAAWEVSGGGKSSDL